MMKKLLSTIGAAACLVGTAAVRADGPDAPATQTVYYDYIDDSGHLAGGSLVLPIERPGWAGTPADPALRGGENNRIDLVVVGDGYTAAEQALFHTQADDVVSTLLDKRPFADYAPFFDVHQIEVVSAQSGVDHDPTQGILRDTALDMGFWCEGVERLLCVDVLKAYNAAAAAPEVEHVLAIANSTMYGGAGYIEDDLATVTGDNFYTTDIAIHEFGHSLGNLADEYDVGGPATYTGPERPEPNVSIRTAAQMISLNTKWVAWLGNNEAAWDGLCTTFQGAFYSPAGIYRPSHSSQMRNVFQPFNHPSAESLIVEFYKIVKPIDDATPAGTVLSGDETVFVDPVDPADHALGIQWRLNGVALAGQTGPTLDLAALGLAAGGYTLSVKVTDHTPLIRNESLRTQWMSQTIGWPVIVEVFLGDLNCDGAVGSSDITALALALTDPAGYAAAFPACGLSRGDFNGDGATDGRDIAGFVEALVP